MSFASLNYWRLVVSCLVARRLALGALRGGEDGGVETDPEEESAAADAGDAGMVPGGNLGADLLFAGEGVGGQVGVEDLAEDGEGGGADEGVPPVGRAV